jgi:hypothetical protein
MRDYRISFTTLSIINVLVNGEVGQGEDLEALILVPPTDMKSGIYGKVLFA